MGRPFVRRVVGTTIAVAVLLLGTSTGANAALPASGTLTISDGSRRMATVSPDGGALALYDVPHRRQIGQTIALPRNAQGRPFALAPVGILGTRVVVQGNDPDAPPTNTGRLYDTGSPYIGIGETDTGQVRWLCAPSGATADPATPTCLRSTPKQLFGYELTPLVLRAGHRWLEVGGGDTGIIDVIRWGEREGRFWARWSTERERGRLLASVSRRELSRGAPIDLDHSAAPTLDDRYGFTARVIKSFYAGNPPFSVRARVALRRRGDRADAWLTIRYPQALGEGGVGFGERGLCLRSRDRLVLWDRSTRRIWTRPVPPGYPFALPGLTYFPVGYPSGRVLCPGSTIALEASAEGGAAISTALRWPTERRPRGWKRNAKLRAGDHRSY